MQYVLIKLRTLLHPSHMDYRISFYSAGRHITSICVLFKLSGRKLIYLHNLLTSLFVCKYTIRKTEICHDIIIILASYLLIILYYWATLCSSTWKHLYFVNLSFCHKETVHTGYKYNIQFTMAYFITTYSSIYVIQIEQKFACIRVNFLHL